MTSPSLTRLIEPTPAEKRNGWTAEALTKYYAEREKAAAIRVFGDPGDKKRRPLKVQNCKKFKPLYWGKRKR